MKRLGLLITLLALGFKIFPQSVYTYGLKKDIVLGALSLGVFTIPFFVENTPDSVPGPLNSNDVNAFDRSLMFPYNKPLDLVSDYGVYSMLLLPAISVIGNIRDTGALLTYGIMYTEAFLLSFGTEALLKNAVIRLRPYMYESGIPDGKEADYYNSFPSGSTTFAFLGASFLSATFLREYPESKWKLPVIIGGYTLAAGVASMRIASGSHFITDTLAGAAIGSFYGWVIPFLHERQNMVFFTGNGIFVSLSL